MTTCADCGEYLPDEEAYHGWRWWGWMSLCICCLESRVRRWWKCEDDWQLREIELTAHKLEFTLADSNELVTEVRQ